MLSSRLEGWRTMTAVYVRSLPSVAGKRICFLFYGRYPKCFFLFGSILLTGSRRNRIFLLPRSLFPGCRYNGRDAFLHNVTYTLQLIEGMHRLGKKEFLVPKKETQRIDMAFL